MVLQGSLAVSALELCLAGVWRNAENIVESSLFDHVDECGEDRGGLRTIQVRNDVSVERRGFVTAV